MTPQLDRVPTPGQTISLLDVEPNTGWPLTDEERAAASRIRLGVRTVDPGVDFVDELDQMGAFGAIVLDGVLVHELRIGERTGIHLLGPGDVVIAKYAPDPLVLTGVRWATAGQVRAAFMGTRMLVGLTRWPRLMVGLYRQSGQQVDRLATQLLICQLPRVEDRILALMWLLADTWGRVTAAGTRLSVDLTHEALGRMIGARRPTVTLALRELAVREALVRQANGWLLLQPPPSEESAPQADGARISRAPLAAVGVRNTTSAVGRIVPWKAGYKDPMAQKLNVADLKLSSPAFKHHSPIPARHSGDGEDVAPALGWSGVPEGTKAFAVVVHDPDAPLVDGFTHWVAYGIQGDASGLPEGGGSATAGTNSFGNQGYNGPAPPPGHGTHHYYFWVYALDESPELEAGLDRRALLERIEDHVIEQARLVGTYKNED